MVGTNRKENGENKYKLLQYKELPIIGKYELSESMKRIGKDKKVERRKEIREVERKFN